MELRTGKVVPLAGESQEEVLRKLCTQFALLIDEVGFYVTKLSQQNKELEKKVKELADKLAEETEGA